MFINSGLKRSTLTDVQVAPAKLSFLMLAMGLLVVCMFGIQSSHAQSSEFGPPFIIADGFSVPSGLGIDVTNGRVFLADTGNHCVKYTAIADLQSTHTNWNEFGYVANRSLPEALNAPQAVAVDAGGNVFVVDTFGNEVQLYRWDAGAGTYTYDPYFTQTTRNTVNGMDIAFPRDVAVGPDSKVYLLDSGNHRILVADGPDDDSWAVWRENSAWDNPYGFDVADDGTVYLADTDLHQILRISITGEEQVIGHYGTGNGQFRHPRDVAVSRDGKLFVADTCNHRVVVLNADGSHYRNLGAKALFGNIQKIEVDGDNRVFVLDSDYNKLIAYLGPVEDLPFDAYIRDHLGDSGLEPSAEGITLSSPDILVRYRPDIDLSEAATIGLEAYEFEQPLYGENNYVYLAVHNRGTQGIAGVTTKLYWADPSSALKFPSDWNTDGFYSSYTNETANSPGNTLPVPYIPLRQMAETSEVDGVMVIGPIIWRPPAPDSAITEYGNFYLLTRLIHIDDLSEVPPADAPALNQMRINNNIALRSTQVTRDLQTINVTNHLNFRVDVGSASTKLVHIRNEGTADLKILGMTLSNTTIFSLHVNPGSNPCGSTTPTIPAGSKCTVGVTFSPSRPAEFSEDLIIRSDDRDNPKVTVSLTGTGLDPDISVSPTSIDFGTVYAGKSSVWRYVTISNIGTEDLHISDIALFIGPDFSLLVNPGSNPCGSTTPTIPAGGNCNIRVEFRPLHLGNCTSRLYIRSDDPDNPYVWFSLSGIGRPASEPNIWVSPASVNFSDVVIEQSSKPRYITISNLGTEDLHARIAPLVTDQFTVNVNPVFRPCGSWTPTISGGSGCTIRVWFNPSSRGIKRDEIAIWSNDPDSEWVKVSLEGYGIPHFPQVYFENKSFSSTLNNVE